MPGLPGLMYRQEPSSDFLQELSASDDPGIPYTVIAGNTSLINSPPDSPVGKLIASLKNLVELPFYGEPNDIAVTVKSIKAIPAGRNPAPVITEVDCDHLVYFTNPSGKQALGTAVQQALTEELPNRALRSETATTPKSQSTSVSVSSPKAASLPTQWLWIVIGVLILILGGLSGLHFWQTLQIEKSQPTEVK